MEAELAQEIIRKYQEANSILLEACEKALAAFTPGNFRPTDKEEAIEALREAVNMMHENHEH